MVEDLRVQSKHGKHGWSARQVCGVATLVATVALAPAGCGAGGGGGSRAGAGKPPAEWGARSVELTTLEAGAGAHPAFSWKPVTGAARYRVVVQRDGATWWTWEGAGTSVVLGGGNADAKDATIGPVLEGSARWSVAALAASGAVLGLSGLRRVSR